MEYAMCTLITGERKLGSLIGVTAHELAHTWFQFLLATNESKHEWMDEGFTSFISTLAENEVLKEEKIYSNDTVVMINNSNLLVENKSIKDNKLIYYPLTLCFIFILVQLAKNTYTYLDRLEVK